MAKQGVKLPPAGQYGVGMVFLPRDPASRIACEYEIERAINDEGQVLLGWRDVPVDNSDLAEPAKRLEPVIRQVFIGRGRGVTVTDALERKLYVIRKSSGHAIQALKLMHGKEFYVPTMSARTICYKGMLLAYQVGEYYLDLKDPRVESALALVHQRFSTNTFPSWDLAHPFRIICHNGEINTVRGNVRTGSARARARSPRRYWARTSTSSGRSSIAGQSDSASFDNAVELLVMGGYSVAHAMMMMIPEAWENHTLMDPARRAFYEYHAAMMEPWDGPASIAFTDGRQIGATLDRNGLRPSRYIVTDDDLVIMGSECGCLPVPEEKIVKKWRLQPGKMFLVDLEKGRIVDDKELKDGLAEREAVRRVDRAHPREAGRGRDRKDPAAQVAACRCSTASRRSPTRRRTSSSSWSRWPWPARSRSARWATTRRSRCSRTRTRRSITISSSSSRRSPTPRSTRSARSW